MKNLAVVKNSFIFSFVLLFFPLQIQAEAVANLYQTVVPVTNQSSAERLRAMRVGLGKVLVKVTGDSQALANVSYSNPEHYVTEFGYVSYRNPEAPVGGTPGLGMSLNYDTSAINRLLRQHQLQVWPSDRPGLLVWMVIDDPQGGKHFVTSENMHEAVETLKTLMDDRGAPLILPLFDLQDSRNISEANVWNLNSSRLATAAERYNTKAWMALRLYRTSTGAWRATRLLNLNGNDNLKNVVADNISALMNKIVPGAVDSLASQYAYVPKDGTEEVLLQLENINDYEAFSQATNYLESLEVVRRITVNEVNGSHLGLKLFVEGEVALLLDTLRRDRNMKEKTPVIVPNPVAAPKLVVVPSDGVVSTAAELRGLPELPEPKSFYFVWGRH